MRQAKWILQRTDRLREWVRLFFDRRCPTQAAWYRANKILVDAIELELCGAGPDCVGDPSLVGEPRDQLELHTPRGNRSASHGSVASCDLSVAEASIAVRLIPIWDASECRWRKSRADSRAPFL